VPARTFLPSSDGALDPPIALPDEHFVIAFVSSVQPLTDDTLQIGPIVVDMGNTSFQVPSAPDYIRKVQKCGTIEKKRKTRDAECGKLFRLARTGQSD
jgi:hypothetical protein